MNQKHLFKLLSNIFLICFLVLTVSCGASTGDDDSSDDTTTGTSTNAEEGASAAVTATMTVLTTILGGDESVSVIPPSLFYNLKEIPRTLTVSETSACAGAAASNTGGSSLILYGSDLDANGSGSCTLTSYMIDSEIGEGSTGYLYCDSFNGAEATNNVTLDGNLGILVSNVLSSDENAISMTVGVGTQNLTMGFIQDGSTKLCDIKLSLYETAVIDIQDTYAIMTTETSGCISVCDAAFTITGSESETIYFDSE